MKKEIHDFRLWLLASAIALVVFGFILSPLLAAEPAPPTIKIGVVIALTGRGAAGGKDVIAGYELAVKHINDAGGVMVKQYGKKIPLELVVVDDESDPVKTATRLDRLYSVDKVVAYLSGFSSALNVVGMAAAEKHKIPWIGVTIAVEAPFNTGGKWTFAAWAMSSDQVKSYFDLLDSIPKDLRPTKIAHFEVQDDWGKECGAYLRQTAKERGYAVVVDSKYASASNDFSSLILQARSTGADTLFMVGSPPQSMLIPRQMKELNYAPKLTLLINGPGLSTYWKSIGKDANYILSDGIWDETMTYPGNKKLVDDYNAAYPGMESIGTAVGASYAATQILANAIQRAGSLDRQKIRDAIMTTDLVTVRGPIKFKANGTAVLRWGLRQWQNGQNVLIWPPEATKNKVILALPWDKR